MVISYAAPSSNKAPSSYARGGRIITDGWTRITDGPQLLHKRHIKGLYTIEELKWDILILQWSGTGNDLK